MRSYRIVLAAVLLASVPSLVLAVTPVGDGRFSKLVPGTDQHVSISGATLKDKVFFHVHFTASNGEHLLRVNVYDGNGNEVFNAETTLLVKNGKSGRSVTYGFDAGHDAPGTWWYVAALDGKVLISNSINVSQ